MDRAEYAALATAAARVSPPPSAASGATGHDQRFPCSTIRICIARIESHGAIVAAEDDWWGSRAGGRRYCTDGDPVEAIFDKYYLDAPSPRVFPPAVADDWFLDAAASVNGVVFYLPPEDDVLGWDYPRTARSG